MIRIEQRRQSAAWERIRQEMREAANRKHAESAARQPWAEVIPHPPLARTGQSSSEKGYTEEMQKREPHHTTATAPKTRGAKSKHGGLKRVLVLLSDQHAQFLKEQESASALIRMLLDSYIAEQ
jgi:hypothetical protein